MKKNKTEDNKSTLEKMLGIPEVQKQYDVCKNKGIKDIPKCIWEGAGEGAGEGEGVILPLAEETKKQVTALYKEEELNVNGKEKPVPDQKNTKNNFTNRSLNLATDYKSDPAAKALTAFFGKQLDKVLNSKDKDDKTITTVDHQIFIDLYESELGKSIVNAFTSYCLETNPKCRIPAPSGKFNTICLSSKESTTRDKYIAVNLKVVNGEGVKFSEEEGKKWNHCIASVPSVCYELKAEDKDKDKDDKEYSKQKACLVMDFVKSSRKNLISINEQKEFYKKFAQSNYYISDANNKNNREDAKSASVRVINLTGEASADKITQITSGDIKTTEGIGEENEKIAKRAEECTKGEKGSASINSDKCKEFISINTDKNAEAIAEFGLRQYAKKEILEKELEDPQNVKAYLKEEGYKDEEIAELTKEEKNIKEIREKIKTRFDQEKDAFIKEMASRIDSKTTEKNGSITTESHDAMRLGTIKKELASRNVDLKKLIHFNNIVSSYLEVGDGKTKSRNTASLFAELKTMDDKAVGANKEAMNEGIKKSKLNENSSTSKLEVDTINNKLLNYIKEQ